MPFDVSAVEQVDIPGKAPLSTQGRADRLASASVRIMEPGLTRVLEPRRQRGHVCVHVGRQHLHPDDHGRQVEVVVLSSQDLVHRTGALQALRSGRRQEGNQPDLVPLQVEFGYQRLDRFRE